MLPIPADIFTEPEDVELVAPPKLNPLAMIVNDRAKSDHENNDKPA